MTKLCFKCNKEKGLTEFYKHSEMADGYLGKCKECAKKDATEHRNKNIERFRAYDRQRNKLPHRLKQNAKCNLKYIRDNPLRYAANRLLRYAVETVKIIKPRACSICHKETKILGHHEDYCKPLEVIWVCQVCHKKIHKEKENGV
ncbi:hypothetical protein LCGC14_1472970 [marine sediment metagenome]|uniref:Uncharacterized protein n=1 Tax=marine sediment metagenome TaxID=412755 RepID=A0A0F9JBR1_9ZZZZ